MTHVLAQIQSYLKQTAPSRGGWTIDEIQWLNHRTLMMYVRLSEGSGLFIMVTHNGSLSIGHYNGAIPTITDACFTSLYEYRFIDHPTALMFIIAAGLKLELPNCQTLVQKAFISKP